MWVGMAATEDEAWEPPLLSWKGMQLWSVGCRAPALCHMFMGLKNKKLPNLINAPSTQPKEAKKSKRRKRRDADDHGTGSTSLQLPARLSSRCSLDDVPVTVPQRQSISVESSWGPVSNQLRRNSDASATNLKRFSDHLRRNSDASLCHLQRRSTSSAPPCGGYERVWALEGANDGRLDYMLPREVKLGGRRSDVSVHLGRQDSGISVHRRSSCSSSSSSSSVASAASTALKITSGRTSTSSRREHHHLNELLVGNQFLTHLTAAPVAPGMAHMYPSDGLLLDASVRCREAELKDRIIFFL